MLHLYRSKFYSEMNVISPLVIHIMLQGISSPQFMKHFAISMQLVLLSPTKEMEKLKVRYILYLNCISFSLWIIVLLMDLMGNWRYSCQKILFLMLFITTSIVYYIQEPKQKPNIYFSLSLWSEDSQNKKLL